LVNFLFPILFTNNTFTCFLSTPTFPLSKYDISLDLLIKLVANDDDDDDEEDNCFHSRHLS
jgi:hypothetical protein